MNFVRMKIKLLLPLLFTLLIVLGAIQGDLAIYSMNVMEDEGAGLSSRLNRTLMIADMERNFADVRRFYAVLLGARGPDEVARAVEPLKHVAFIQPHILRL